MNNQQRKILIFKILPKAILVLIILVGFVAFIWLKIAGEIAKNQVENIDSEKISEGLKDNKKSNEVYKKITVDKLSLLLGDWKIEKEYTFPEDGGKAGGIILSNKMEKVVFISYTTHKFISDLHEYSEHSNERTIRNMKPTGVYLKSKKLEDIKFKGRDAVKETFECIYEPTGEISEYVSINIKYNGVFYTLGYTNETNSLDLISTIEFLD